MTRQRLLTIMERLFLRLQQDKSAATEDEVRRINALRDGMEFLTARVGFRPSRIGNPWERFVKRAEFQAVRARN